MIPGLGLTLDLTRTNTGVQISLLLVRKPLLPGECYSSQLKGSRMSPQKFCPESESPKLREQGVHGNAKAWRGFISSLSQGPPPHPMQWSGARAPSPDLQQYLFISLEQRQGVGKGWLAAGVSWYLLIGQLSSLWLARVIIPGSPGSMTQGLFLA